MAGRRRGGTLGDMVRSLLFVLAIIGVLALIYPRHHYAEVHTVDYSVDVAAARQSAGYQVLAPAGLPDRWRATSSRATLPDPARGRPALRLHVGFVTPTDEYAALEESGVGDKTFATGFLRGERQAGAVTVAGREWTSYAGKDGRSLVATVRDARIVLTGSASLAELEFLAAALR